MASVTLAQLRTRVKQRSDNEHTGSEFVTDDEIDQLINVSNNELYGHLTRAGVINYERIYTVTPNGATRYELPTDIYAIVAVFRVDNSHRTMLGRHSHRMKPNLSVSGTALSYRVLKDESAWSLGATQTLELYPLPTSGTYEVVYIPEPTALALDADAVNYGLGWEEYIVVDASIKILEKGEQDSRTLQGERERLLQRIQDEAVAQELSESNYIDNINASADDGILAASNYHGRRGVRGGISSAGPWWRW